MMVLNAGRVEQIGTPAEVYAKPASLFVAGFIGSPPMNLLPVHCEPSGQLTVDSSTEGQPYPLSLATPSYSLPAQIVLGIRPEHLQLCPPEVAMARVEVRIVENLGADAYAYCLLNGQEIIVRLNGNSVVRSGDCLPITAASENLHVFDSVTGKRITP